MPETTGNRPKVLFVMPNFAGGGAERVALTLLSRVDRARFQPHLAVLDGKGPFRSLLSEGVILHELGHKRLRRALPALLRLIRRERPAVVFASQGYLNIGLLVLRACFPRNTRVAIRESSTPSLSLPNRSSPRLMAWAYRRFYPAADLVLCQHRGTEQEMTADFNVAPERVASLPNPVAVEALRRAASPVLRHEGPGQRFVAAGRLSPEKGFDRLVALFAGLAEDSRLTIYGDGGERAALAQQIRALGLAERITLAGFSDRLPAALAGADACVISSHWEGLPNVALEALAVGTPVIATPESGGIAELAEAAAPGTVTLAAWGDPFAAAMRACPIRALDTPAESLLPERFALENVAATFNRHLLRLAGSSDVLYEGQP